MSKPLADKLIDINLEGIFSIYTSKKQADNSFTDWKLEFSEKNLILNQSAFILRDLMAGDETSRISKLLLGDLGMDSTHDLSRADPPKVTDTEMVSQVYEVNLESSNIIVDGNPAIQYQCTISDFEMTPNPTDIQLIMEYALATVSGQLFSKKNKAGIYKDNETMLKIVWIIVFRLPTKTTE